MDTRTARALPVLLALGGMWGASFLFIKVLVDYTGPVEIAFGRCLLGVVSVGAFVLITRRQLQITPDLARRVSVLAVVNNVLPFTLISWAETHIPSGTASILNATVPISTAMIAVAVLYEEVMTAPRLGGLLLAFLGVGVLTGGDISDFGSNLLGELAVIAASALYGAGTVYARRVLHGQDPVSVSLVQLSCASVLLLPVLLVVRAGTPDASLSLKAWGCILALGLGGTGLAYIAYFWLIEHLGSVRASLVTYIIPIVGVFLGWLALDESIGIETVLGGLIIVAGVASVMRGQAPVREPPIIGPVGAPASVSGD